MKLINFPFIDGIGFHWINHEYSFVFYIAFMTLSLILLLKSYKMFIGQFVLFLSFSLLNETVIPSILAVMIMVQIALSVFVLCRFKKAIDRNYQLILEKTHQSRPQLTKNSNGSQKSFF